MSFANAGALLLFLPLGGVIVLLYLLKMRRRDLRVPATFLWPAQTEEVRANALFQTLKPSWLLFLQLLAAFVVVLCLARPQTRQRGLVGEVTVFVLDSSASMGATDVTPSRFAEAKRLAREGILSTRPGDRIALVEAGPVPRVVFALGNDPLRQAAALDAVKGTDAEGDMGEAMRLASAVVNGLDGARIVLLSDGVFDPIRDFSQGKASVVYRSVGKGEGNVAVEALGLSETPRGRLLYAGLRNYGPARETTLTLFADGKAIDSSRIRLDKDGSTGRTVVAPTGVRLFEARLDSGDALRADDYAAVAADPSAALRVLTVGGEDPFLERALALDPRVTLDRAASLPADGGAAYDVVAFDGVPSEPTKSRGVLILGRAGVGAPVVVQAGVKTPKPTEAEDVPLLKGVDLDGVYIDSGEQVRPASGATVVARSSAGPLVVTSERGQRQVYVAFAPLQSDFPLQVGFPIFVGNALDFLGGNAGGSPLVVRAGRPFSLPVSGEARLVGEGQKIALRTVNGAATVREMRRVGRYAVESSGKPRTVVATLQSPRESAIRPVAEVAMADRPVRAMAAPLRFGDFWRPLGTLLLLVLGIEWWTYARRS